MRCSASAAPSLAKRHAGDLGAAEVDAEAQARASRFGLRSWRRSLQQGDGVADAFGSNPARLAAKRAAAIRRRPGAPAPPAACSGVPARARRSAGSSPVACRKRCSARAVLRQECKPLHGNGFRGLPVHVVAAACGCAHGQNGSVRADRKRGSHLKQLVRPSEANSTARPASNRCKSARKPGDGLANAMTYQESSSDDRGPPARGAADGQDRADRGGQRAQHEALPRSAGCARLPHAADAQRHRRAQASPASTAPT